jgi:ankyrin repeat protein
MLVQANADLSARDNKGTTVMHIAAHQGHHTVMEFWLLANADVSARTKGGETPLHWAVHKEDSKPHVFFLGPKSDNKVVNQLLAAGADLFAADEKGETPFNLAMRDGDDVVMQTLINASVTAPVMGRGTALCRAMSDGNYERMRSILIAMQTNTDGVITENHDVETALHLAAKKGDEEMLEAFFKVIRDIYMRKKTVILLTAESMQRNEMDAD